MNTLKNILSVLLITLVFVSCKNDAKPEVKTIEVETSTETAKAGKAELDPDATYAKAEFTIEGMTCAMGCAKTIEKKIAKMEGVKSAIVDFDKKLAMVEYDEAKVTTTSLEETVKKVGETYTVKEMKTVESFSAKKACDANCKKACCADKTDAEKTACAKDCKKACCADKAKVAPENKMACAKDCKKACCIKEAKA